MAIILNDNIQTNAPKPSDARYMDGNVPYPDVVEANSALASSVRHIGLKVNVNYIDYWYKDGIDDADLVEYSSGSSGGGSGTSGNAEYAELAGTALHIDDGDSSSDGELGGGGSPTTYTFNNGLSESLGIVKLGGPLTGDTTIDLSTHELTIASNSLLYAADYSGDYVDRSLVDKGYVDVGDTNAKSRVNHTGTQLASTISDISTASVGYSGTSGLALNSVLLNSNNSSFYLSRTNHTGSQTASTISDFSTAADTRINLKVSGLTNVVSKFTGTNVVGQANITDNGTTVNVTINQTVAGTFGVTGASTFTGDVTCAGNLVIQGQAYVEQGTLTFNASQAWNLNTYPNAVVTLTSAATMQTPSNMKAGGTYSLIVKQDGTGSRALGYSSSYKWGSGVAPVLSTAANAVDIITFISDGTYMYGSIIKAFA